MFDPFKNLFEKSNLRKIYTPEMSKEGRIKEIDNFVDSVPSSSSHWSTESSGSYESDPFARFFWARMESSENKELFEYLKNKLEGRTLIDLGSNIDFLKRKKEIKDLGVKDYIAVDRFRNFEGVAERNKDFVDDVNLQLINNDMLKYVARLPDNSANFTMSGTGFEIIRSSKYWGYLSEELHRVMYKDGIIFGADSYISDKDFEDKFKAIVSSESRLNDSKFDLGLGDYILERKDDEEKKAIQ